MKIAYLGPVGTFTEKAAKELYPSEELIPKQSIIQIVKSVENNIVDLGIVPLENFYEGEVRETLDVLRECNNTYIIRDKSIEIIHCLGVLPNNKIINKIISKDQALGQCQKYLYENYPEVITMSASSTAEGIQKIKNENILDSAVIASEEALLNSGLKIIAKNICPNNKTRFIVLGNKKNKPTGKDKTFLVFHPIEKDKPGTLQGNLGFFSNLGINLEYIQSRPDGKGGYYFYIELDGHEEDESVQIALKALRYSLDPKNKQEDTIKILGSYPNTDWKSNNKL